MSLLMIWGRRLLLAAGLALGLAAAGPSVAAAKTYTAYPKDDTGDSVQGAPDIASSRIAYNRKSGAMSISVTMDETIEGGGDALVLIWISNLVGGKCTKPIFVLGGLLSQPRRVFAQRFDGLTPVGKQRWGSGSIDDATFSMRVRHRSFSGDTPGCTQVLLADPKDIKSTDPAIYDRTAGNDGFI